MRAPTLVLHLPGAAQLNPSRKLSAPDHLLPFLRMSVTDVGPGIAPHELPLLFHPYTQIRAGELQKGMGTGLGLAFCKSITELAGGNVGATSIVGAGSEFWMEIPLIVTATSDATLQSVVLQPEAQLYGSAGVGLPRPFGRGGDLIAPSAETAPALSQRSARDIVAVIGAAHASVQVLASTILARVVVVDDVLSTRILFSRLLQRGGASVVFTAEHGMDCLMQLSRLLDSRNAADGAQGAQQTSDDVNAVRAEADVHELARADALIDAWFIDGNMPVMDGLELIRRLRQAGILAPIIAVTGNALSEDQALLTAAGASAVLTKPCTSVTLEECLGHLGACLPRPIAVVQLVVPLAPLIQHFKLLKE